MKPPRRTCKLLNLSAGTIAVLTAALAISVVSRAGSEMTNPAAPGKENGTVAAKRTVVPATRGFQRAFDRLTERTDREKLSALAIVYPAELEQELAKLKSPEELADEALGEFAILQPAEYAALNPRPASSEEAWLAVMDEAGLARYAQTNATANFDQLKARIGLSARQQPDRERLKAQALAAMERPDQQPLPPPMRPSVNPKP